MLNSRLPIYITDPSVYCTGTQLASRDPQQRPFSIVVNCGEMTFGLEAFKRKNNKLEKQVPLNLNFVVCKFITTGSFFI